MPLAVKIPLYARVNTMQIEAEGEWIGFDNAGETTALLRPEEVPDAYDRSAKTTAAYISGNGLREAYLQYLEDEELSDSEQSRTGFLVGAEQYSAYLKWACRGPGVWRYLASVKRASYWGE